MQIKQIGIDIGKNSFHVDGLGTAGDIVLRRQFTRSGLIAFFKQRTEDRLIVAFEACSGAHWLAHQLMAMGHDVRLLTPESVRPFAKSQKNDWNDALAISEAAQRPGRHAVGIKSQERLDIQASDAEAMEEFLTGVQDVGLAALLEPDDDDSPMATIH